MFKKLIYYYYQKKLKSEVLGKNKKKPEHIGIILDGNRRYAEKYGFDNVSKGHKKGADKLSEVLSWCIELDITCVTVWAFSTDNFKRDKLEVDKLLNIIKSQLQSYITSRFINDNKICVKIIGKRDLLSKDLLDVIEMLENKTKDYSNLILYIAVGYGGRQEICDALIDFISDNISDLNKLQCEDVSALPSHNCDLSYRNYNTLSNIVTVENISRYLYAKDAPDPDLIIRTSGETRLSGFLLWQSAYSEFYFCDAYWPEFREIDFLRAIRSYQSRDIRKGL